MIEKYILLNTITKTYEILTKDEVNQKFNAESPVQERGIYKLYDFHPNEELDISSIRLYGL